MKTHTIRKLLAPLMVLVLYLCACNNLQARDFVVVIDPGHGGKDVGCVGNYSYEKDIVMAVGKMLGDKIKKNYPNVKVVYTRDTDRFIPLQDRANIANHNHADLFISIHVNSVAAKTKNRSSIQGTSVYTLGAERTAANLEVAKRENSVIILEEDYTSKYGGYDPDNPESDIMMGLLQNRYINESIDFASQAQNQLVSTAGRADHGVKQAGFLVLRNVSAPAVLVELDFICNPTQEKFLSSKAGQEKMATSLYNAFRSFINAKMRQANVTIEETQAKDSKDDGKGKDKDKKYNDKDKSDKKDKDNKDGKDKPQATAPVAEQKPQSPTPSKTQPEPSKPVQNNSSQAQPAPTQQKQQQSQSQTPAEQKPAQTQPSQQKPQESQTQQKPAQQKPAQQVQAPEQPSQQKPQQKAQEVKTDEPKKEAQNVPTPTEHVQKQFKNAQAVGVPQAGEIQYKIQIFTSNKILKAGAPDFKGLKDVDYYKDGVYKYTVGLTSDKAEADRILKSVQSKFPQAFIIQWKDGHRVK